MDWTVDNIEEVNGTIVAATIVLGDRKVRLVDPEYVMKDVAALDPMGRLVGSIFAEMFVGSRLTKEELKLRQTTNAGSVAFQHMAKQMGKPSAKRRRNKK